MIKKWHVTNFSKMLLVNLNTVYIPLLVTSFRLKVLVWVVIPTGTVGY